MSNLLVRLSTAFGLSLLTAGCATTGGNSPGSINTLGGTGVQTKKGPVGTSSVTKADCTTERTVNVVIVKFTTPGFDEDCAKYKALTTMVGSGDTSMEIIGTAALAEKDKTLKKEVLDYAEGKRGEKPKTSKKTCEFQEVAAVKPAADRPKKATAAKKEDEQVTFDMVCR